MLQQSTHTQALYGNINDVFSAQIWINKEQQNNMIAHVRVGEMQLAVHAIINVLPPIGDLRLEIKKITLTSFKIT